MLQGGTKVTAYFRVTLTVSSFPLKITDPLFLLVDCNKEEDKKDWYPLRQLQTQRVGALRAPCPSYSKDVLSLTFYAYLGLSIPSGGVALECRGQSNAAFVCVEKFGQVFCRFQVWKKAERKHIFRFERILFSSQSCGMFQTFCLWLSFVLDFTGGISVCRSPPHNVAGSTPLYFLSVAVVLRDEENFVEEWARHYLAEGVEYVYRTILP